MESNVPEINHFRGEHEFLSNFFCHQMTYEGVLWTTSEHAYQAAKTVDQREIVAIWQAPTPGKAKRLGKTATLREDWDEIKVAVMTSILEAKFSDEDLESRLVLTYPSKLVEGNTWNDTFWGVDIRSGKGQNMLGKILMQIRAEKLMFGA